VWTIQHDLFSLSCVEQIRSQLIDGYILMLCFAFETVFEIERHGQALVLESLQRDKWRKAIATPIQFFDRDRVRQDARSFIESEYERSLLNPATLLKLLEA